MGIQHKFDGERDPCDANLQELQGPHPVNGAKDSILGSTDSKEFVVYDPAQVYPEYVMWLRLEEPSGSPNKHG